MSRMVLALLLTVLIAGPAGAESAANIPDPSLSIVPSGVLLVPNNPPLLAAAPQVSAIGYTVTVIGNLGPVQNALVQITFTAAAEHLIAWCNGVDGAPATPHPVVAATTNNAGQATFRISGGGCILPNQVNPFAVEIKANGVVLQTDLAVLSFDAVNSLGQTSQVSGTNSCEPTPQPAGPNKTTVGLGDAVYHTGPFSSGVYNRCSDFTNDGSVTLADVTLATQFIVDGLSCTCTP